MGKIACVIATAPYGQRVFREALEVVMACAAFDMPPALFFIDDGVLGVIKEQSPKPIGQKNVASILKSLPLFDVNLIHVCESSLKMRGMRCSDLLLSPKVFDRNEMHNLLESYTHVLTF